MKSFYFLVASVVLLLVVSIAAVRGTRTIAVAQDSLVDSASSGSTAGPLAPYLENAIGIRCNACGMVGGPRSMDKHACPLKASIAIAWSLSSTEKFALAGIEGRIQALNSEIARVASGDAERADAIVKVALTLRAIDHDEREIVKEASSSRQLEGVALVQSNVGWALQR